MADAGDCFFGLPAGTVRTETPDGSVRVNNAGSRILNNFEQEPPAINVPGDFTNSRTVSPK